MSMKWYITKYALTSGIEEIESDFCNKGDQFWHIRGRYKIYRENEIFQTREEAVADANMRKERKIASLKRQIQKLENLTF